MEAVRDGKDACLVGSKAVDGECQEIFGVGNAGSRIIEEWRTETVARDEALFVRSSDARRISCLVLF